MIWQLCQVRHVSGVPLIFLGEMWQDLQAWARNHMLSGDRDLASPRDLEIPHCVGTVEEAVEFIRRDVSRFNAKQE